MRVFIAHSSRDRELVLNIKEHLSQRGDQVVDPFAYTVTSQVVSQIHADMQSADVVVFLLNASSPAVYYELGYAVGAGIPVLVASASTELLPMDISALPFVACTGDSFRDAQLIAKGLERFQVKRAETDLSDIVDPGGEWAAVAPDDKELVDSLSPAAFEDMVMDWYTRKGCLIEDKAEAGDRGYDFAIRKGSRLFLVEVKKMGRQTLVSVDAVRSLLGAIATSGAAGGIIVSTSNFTSAAKELAKESPLALRTFEDLAANEADLIFPAVPSANPSDRADG
jgi:hypothetical protein